MRKLLILAVLAGIIVVGERQYSNSAHVAIVAALQGRYSCRTPEPENDVSRISQIEFIGPKVVLTGASDNKPITSDFSDNSYKLTWIERKMGLLLVEGTSDVKFSLKIFQTNAGDLLIEPSDGLAEDRSGYYARGKVDLSFNYICSRIKQ